MRFTLLAFITLAGFAAAVPNGASVTRFTPYRWYQPWVPPPTSTLIGQACPTPTAGANGGCGYGAVCAYSSATPSVLMCFAVAGNATPCSATVLCGQAQTCVSGSCKTVYTLGASCQVSPQTAQWCSSDQICIISAPFTISTCLQVAYNGESCDALRICAPIGTATTGTCSTPNAFGFGTCSNSPNRPRSFYGYGDYD